MIHLGDYGAMRSSIILHYKMPVPKTVAVIQLILKMLVIELMN